MNAKRGVVVLAACVALAVAGYLVVTSAGCGPRAQVAKDKMMDQIDQLLGKTEVQRKEAQNGIDDMKKAIDKLLEGKVKAKVQSDQLADQLKTIDDKISDAKTTLATLQEYIKADKPREIAGKTYSPDDLNKLAKRVIEAEKNLETQRTGVQHAKEILDTAVTTLDARQREGQERLEALNSKLKEVDAEMVALKSLKDAAAVMGDTDTTLADKFADSEKKVNDLQVSVKTQLKMDEEKWNAANASKEVDDASKIVADVKGPQDTLNEIDKILGKK
jgi:peptidoglycan hydrolase CwlO-like protein